jgi:hypothetical protein
MTILSDGVWVKTPGVARALTLAGFIVFGFAPSARVLSAGPEDLDG